jgi:hypothetical protein
MSEARRFFGKIRPPPTVMEEALGSYMSGRGSYIREEVQFQWKMLLVELKRFLLKEKCGSSYFSEQ